MSETRPTKVYKVTLCVVDHDGIGEDELRVVIENTRYPNHCIAPKVTSVETRVVGWHGQHPLNLTGRTKMEFLRMFELEPGGNK